ncbi:MAG: peptide chain release factor N(5)-glutamine methyltransferase [Acutalibacteraceae bacterium]|jgi:release factor glutamine methyltransferase
MTIGDALKTGRKYLFGIAGDSADFEALCLLEGCLNKDRTYIHLHSDEELQPVQESRYKDMLNRRKMGEPLQYIIGEWEFYRRPFKVGEGVLIPRPETEEMVQRAISYVRKQNKPLVVFDLCAGSGCIGITIAKECPQTKVYLFEKYDKAFNYLAGNISQNGADNAFPVKCDVLLGFENLKDIPKPDLIISNPPYIKSSELSTLQKEVRFEPSVALDGGDDGLIFYNAFSKKWLPYINDGGAFIFECAEDQPPIIAETERANGFFCDTIEDMYGNMRFVCGSRIYENPAGLFKIT